MQEKVFWRSSMECDLCGGQLGQLQITSFPISITACQEHHGNFNPLIPEYLIPDHCFVLFFFPGLYLCTVLSQRLHSVHIFLIWRRLFEASSGVAENIVFSSFLDVILFFILFSLQKINQYSTHSPCSPFVELTSI